MSDKDLSINMIRKMILETSSIGSKPDTLISSPSNLSQTRSGFIRPYRQQRLGDRVRIVEHNEFWKVFETSVVTAPTWASKLGNL